MNPKSLVLAFAPLVVFSLLTRWVSVEVGALAGLVIAIAVLVSGHRDGVKLLPAVQALSLAAVALVRLIGGRSTDHFLTHYGPGLVSLTLAIAILSTASAAPFTEQFAQAAVTPQVARTKAFRQLNTRISTVWGLAVLALAICHLVSGALPARDRGLQLVLDWGGLAVAFGLALRYTQSAAAQAAKAGSAHSDPAAQEG